MKVWIVLKCFLIVSMLTGCQTAERNPLLQATLWMQTAAEYEANAISIYSGAQLQLKQLLSRRTERDKRPVAIIMDLDETVLDNSPYSAYRVLYGRDYNSLEWDRWVGARQAKLVPGSKEFIEAARSYVRIFFVTNRICSQRVGSDELCPQHQDTRANLSDLGIPAKPDDFFLRKAKLPNKCLQHFRKMSEETLYVRLSEGWPKEKSYRRECIELDYDVVMLIGDDLGDFLSVTKDHGPLSVGERRELIVKNQNRWGVKWFMLPNPTYGSWEAPLKKPIQSQLSPWKNTIGP